MTLPAHSRIGASGMSRWELDHCPGSVRLAAGLSSTSGRAAAEGTVAHHVGEWALLGKAYKAFLGTTIQQDGFDIEVDKAMIEHSTEYKVTVDDLSDADTVRHVEHRFHIEKLHASLFGTADTVLWHPSRQHLDVVDLKYGAGHAVEVENNVQLLYYAIGAVMTLGYKPRTIGLHIFQPRCPHADGPHRTMTISIMDLLDFAGYLLASVKATEDPKAAVRAGEWCRYCPAAGVPNKCPAQAQAAQDLAKVAFSVVHYDPDELAKWLDRLPILEAQVKAVREFAYNEAEAGRPPPRYKLVEKMAREKWGPDATVPALMKAFNLHKEEVQEEPELKSPAQLRKLVPGKNDKERAAKLAPFTVKESSGHTLVHEDDKRPPAKLLARDEFSVVSTVD